MKGLQGIFFAVLAFLIIFLIGCAQSPSGQAVYRGGGEQDLIEAAKGEGKVVFCNNLPTQLAQQIGDSFEEKYGVDVEVVRIAAGLLAQRFYAEMEKGSTGCDVLNNGVTEAFPDWKSRGWFEDISDLPEWENFPASCKDDEGYYADTRTDITITFYNKNLLSEEELPKSLNELTEPKWKGKVGIVDPAVAGTWLLWSRWVVQHPDLGWDFLKRLKENDAVMFVEDGQLTDAIANGRVYITPDELVVYYYRALQQGAPLGVAPTMKEGTITHPQPSAIPVGAPHPNAARLFMNYLMSFEGQMQHVESGLSTCRSDIDAEKLMPWKPSLDEGWQPDWEEVAASKNTQEFLANVTKVLKGS